MKVKFCDITKTKGGLIIDASKGEVPKLGFTAVFQAIHDIDTKSVVLKRYRPYVKVKYIIQEKQINYMWRHTVGDKVSLH